MIDLTCSFLVVTQRKAARQIEAHLMAEDRARADAGAVALFDALGEHAFHQIEVLAHRFCGFAVAMSAESRAKLTAK